tara:strand:- start:4519 stop:5025 length:507 start_codon:yes stop_codon:yes gene_type:complete
MNKEKLFNETSNYVSQNNFDFFITLHFKKEVTKQQARNALDQFLKNINKQLFGYRSFKSLSQISAIEKNRESESFHIHMVIKCPLSQLKKRENANYNYLKKCIKDSWGSASKLTATDELNLSEKSPEWIKPIYDNVGISSYISKQILNNHFDVIEWDKMNVTGKRKKD